MIDYLFFYFYLIIHTEFDLNSMMMQDFFRLRSEPESPGWGTPCWSDDFLRKAMILPTVLPGMCVVRDMLNKILYPRMKIPFRDEAKEDPTYVPKRMDEWNVFLKVGWVQAQKQGFKLKANFSP